MSTPITRYHSCTRCQQRKIKCDGQIPCAACQKANADCQRTNRNTPATKRRRADLVSASVSRQPRLETPHSDAQFSSRSIPTDGDLITPPESVPQHTLQSVTENLATNHSLPFRVESVLFDHASSQQPPYSGWPQPVQIFRLWQTYIDNVNPMINLLHVQTMQRMVLEAATCKPDDLPKQSLALLSSIFLIAVESLCDEDCRNIMKASKYECVRRFLAMTKACLVGAEVMETASTEVLQALVIYLIAARQHSSPQSLWLVIGVAVRLSHRLGIHREKNLQSLTIFAAEMSRRLWWQIYLLNRHYVNLCEDIDSSDPAHTLIFDTKRPLNLNDADLHPEMTTPPLDRDGVTEMLFCSIIYDIDSLVRDLHASSDNQQSKIHAIQQLEARLEDRYARHCDAAIPLQRVSRCLIKTTGYRFALRHHQPAQNGIENQPTREQHQAFDTALLLLQTQHSSCASQILDRYRWHTKLFYCFEALFPVLHTLAFGDISEASSEEAWQQVGLAYRYNPELLSWQHKNFYTSYCHNLNDLALKAWSRKGSTTELMPDFLQQIQLQQGHTGVQDAAEGMDTSVQQFTHSVPEGPASTHQLFDIDLANPESGEQTWEYWLNTFDNVELLGI